MLESTSALLACSSISLIASVLIVASIFFDPSSGTSRHLGLVNRLLLSNIGLSVSLIVYCIVSALASRDELKHFCNAFLPFPMYFFLASYGWTILIAFRFRSNKSWFLPDGQPYQTPYYFVWAAAFVLILPTIINNIAYPMSISTVVSSSSTNMCVYNHSVMAGKVIDLATIQAPLVFTIIINLYSYSLGLFALRDSPHSVLARQMRKAGGYLFMLIIVWVPNVFYNFVSIINNANTDDFLFLETGFCLAALQVSNIPAYIHSYMYMYIYIHCCCYLHSIHMIHSFLFLFISSM